MCKSTGRTVSVHPLFSPARKQYTLAFVVNYLEKVIEYGWSITAAAHNAGIYRSTLRRWVLGFSGQNFNAKWACFFHGDLHCHAAAGLGPALLRHFRTLGNGNLEIGTSLAMVRLHAEFSCRLY